MNGVSARTTHTIVGQVPAGYCTQVAHSMQWLAFIAGSVNLSINVAVSGCTQNNGVEMGIYASDDCQSFRLVSNCNTNMFNNQTWSFTNTEALKPGCIYYLVFDGNGPNSCDVIFSVTAGSAAAPVPNTTGKISGKTLVCRGEQAEYTIPPIFGACSYEWRVENGTLLSALDNRIQVLWDNPGMGKVCVKGVNECQTGNEVCLDVEIGEESPYVELGPYYVCFGGSYKYNNLFLTAGTWNYFFKNRFGCDSNITVIVEELELLESWIDTSLCFPDTLKIANRSFDSTGLYKVVLKSKVSPFCDSTLFINLSYSELLAIARKSGDISCQDSTILLYSDSSRIPANASIRYIWTNSSGDTIGLGPSVSVSQSGSYKLTLIHRIDSLKFCISSQTITVSGSRKTPDLYLLDSLLYCPGDTIFFNNIPVGDRNQSNAPYSIHSGFPCTPQNQIDSAYFILLQDSLLYLKASNGSCVDVIALPFQTRAIDRLLFNDIEQCEGSLLDLNSLTYVREGSGLG
ncbi:MAG TPA: hypothetical protein VFX48_05100, partial [Saprospiraceae bacterium]|nr:hypothetical protein [Saprospiraceae bacterium]